MGDDLARWAATCHGEYCAACGLRLDGGVRVPKLTLCRCCWPDETRPAHAVYAFIMGRANEKWTLCFSDADVRNGPLSLWVLRNTGEECVEVISRWVRRSGIDLLEHLKTFGHAGTIVFLSDRQYLSLVDAGIRDGRNGFEKRRALAAATN